MIWLLGAPAVAQVVEVLEPATQQHFDAALRRESARDYDKAIAAYRLVLTRDPAFTPALLGLARSYVGHGDVDKARKIYEGLPWEADAVLALARLVEKDDPARALKLYERLWRLDATNTDAPLQVARLLVATDPDKAVDAYQFALGLLQGVEPAGEVVLAVATGLWEQGREEAAAGLLQDYLQTWPEGAAAVEARGRLDRWSVEIQARVLGVGGAEALTDEDRARVSEAREQLLDGDDKGALSTLREVVQRSPRAPEAWGALGDVLLHSGQVEEAERSYLWAATLAPEEAVWQAQLGLLYAEHYGGRRHTEAKEAFENALSLRPSWTELHFRLGEVAARLDQWETAIAHFDAYVDAAPNGPHAREARRRVTDLKRAETAPPTLDLASPVSIEDVPEAALARYRVAVVYHRDHQWEAARAELEAVLADAPGWPAALNLLASLELHAKNDADALEAWNRSLAADPKQPAIRVARAEMLRRRGDREGARTELLRAADMGAVDANYYLAAMAWEDGQPFYAQGHLRIFLEGSTPDHLLRPLALALDEQVERRIFQIRAGLTGVGTSLGVLFLSLVVTRLRRAQPLTKLVETSPEAVHDVVRTLSAIRHEVLKHNTTLLDEVGDALDNGDFHAVSFAALRLFGDEGTPGVLDRFDAYLRSLERLGRRHGVRLDLRREDPILSPMWQALRRLRKLERDLRSPSQARRDTAEKVRVLSKALNEDGYKALGQFIRKIGALTVTSELLLDVDARVRSEPGFEKERLPALDLRLPEEGIPLRVFKGDLEDIAANLLRNSYRALVDGLEPNARKVGLTVTEEADPVTGIEEVVFSFFDNAPGQITTEMIRGRNIGRGLGLALDLVTRHDGSLAVRPSPSGKHIEVRLPRAEEAQ